MTSTVFNLIVFYLLLLASCGVTQKSIATCGRVHLKCGNEYLIQISQMNITSSLSREILINCNAHTNCTLGNVQEECLHLEYHCVSNLTTLEITEGVHFFNISRERRLYVTSKGHTRGQYQDLYSANCSLVNLGGGHVRMDFLIMELNVKENHTGACFEMEQSGTDPICTGGHILSHDSSQDYSDNGHFRLFPSSQAPSTRFRLWLWIYHIDDGRYALTCSSGTVSSAPSLSSQVTTQSPVISSTTQSLAVSSTSQSVTTAELKNISMSPINQKNAAEIAKKVNRVTRNSSREMEPCDIKSIAEILDRLATTDTNISEDFVGIIDNVIVANTSILHKAQSESNTSTRILQALVDQAEKVDLGSSSNKTVVKANVASIIWDTSEVNVVPIGYGAVQDPSKPLSINNIVPYNNSNLRNYSEVSAGILLNSEILDRIKCAQSIQSNKTNAGPIRVSFQMFRKGSLFGFGDKSIPPVNSMVVAATVHNVDTRNLTMPVEIIFKPLQSIQEKPHCVHWNFSAAGGLGNWSTEGCSSKETQQGEVICHCKHLTNFAILGIWNQSEVAPKHQKALSIISLVGLTLSSIGLLLTIATFLIFKKFRKSRGQKVLFNLALSLLAVNMIFLAGMGATTGTLGCKVVAALLHYFLLVSFAWMLVEAVEHYFKLVIVLGTYIPGFMLKASVPAWVIPMVPVILVTAIDHNLYKGNSEYCWLTAPAIYYAFLLPVGLVLLTNVVLFILIIKSMICRPADVRSTMHENERRKLQANAGVTCCILMGLTWIFGFMAVSKASLVFQYLFCIFNAFQGFFIFAFFLLREQSVSQAWADLFNRLLGRNTVTQGRNVGVRGPNPAMMTTKM